MDRKFSRDLSVQFSEDEINESMRSRDGLFKLQDCHNKLFQLVEFYHEDFEKEKVKKGKVNLLDLGGEELKYRRDVKSCCFQSTE